MIELKVRPGMPGENEQHLLTLILKATADLEAIAAHLDLIASDGWQSVNAEMFADDVRAVIQTLKERSDARIHD